MPKKPEVYPLRYTEDFFGISNEVAAKLSKCVTGSLFTSLLGGLMKGEIYLARPTLLYHRPAHFSEGKAPGGMITPKEKPPEG